MGLRNVHRRTERGPSKIGLLLSGAVSKIRAPKRSPAPAQQMFSQRMPHERKLITPKKPAGPQVRKDIILISIIAIAAIIAIYFMFTTMGAPAEHKPVKKHNATENKTNETNQTPLIVKKPDLAVTSFTVSDETPLTDEPLTIKASYENRGKADAADTVIQFLAGSTLLKEEELENLTVGKSGEISFEWTPKDEDLGQRILKVVIDPKSKIDEESDANNEQTKNIEVKLNLVRDVSDSFKLRASIGVGDKWYSDKYGMPPKSGPTMTYFQLYQEQPGVYLLDVGAAGFKARKAGMDIYAIEVPDASSDGWNGGTCIREHEDNADCIWTGPEMTFTISFSSGDMIATDQTGVKARATCSKTRVDEIELAGMTVADWPEDLKTFRILGADSPDKFVPSELYTIQGNKIYVNPMMWNPTTGEAKVATSYSFRITV